MLHLLVLLGILVPLALDTFAVGAALGVAGIAPEQRLRTSLVLSAFEAVMPIAGAVAGSAVGSIVGQFAGWTAIAFLAFAGFMLLRPADEADEERRLRLLARAQGFAIIDIGIAISLDELAVGFSIGLIGLPLAVAVAWIAVQAFLAAQLGMRVGARIGEAVRERTEKAAGLLLLATAAGLLVLRLTSGSL